MALEEVVEGTPLDIPFPSIATISKPPYPQGHFSVTLFVFHECQQSGVQ